MSRLALIFCLVAGCFLSRGDDDAGTDVDGDVTLPDGMVCPQYGPYRSCEGACLSLCPIRSGLDCNEETGICFTFPGVGETDSCTNITTGHRYCRFGDRICVVGQDPEQTSGQCREMSLCAPAKAAGARARCLYSDGTEYDDGPPEEACPAPIEDGAGGFERYCGPTCAEPECTNYGGSLGIQPRACVGVSETRGLGICVLDEGNAYNHTIEVDTRLFAGYPDGHRFLWLVFTNPDGELFDWGYLIENTACDSYRSRYPGQVACVNPLLGWEDVGLIPPDE